MKDSIAVTATDAEIISADEYRGGVEIQHTGGSPMWLGFGEAAEVGKGLQLSSAAPYYMIADHRARMAIHAVCDTGNTATGGYQTT